MKYQIVEKGNPNYPRRLLEMKPFMDDVLEEDFDSPEKLHVGGEGYPNLLNPLKSISIIGTRSPFYKAFEIGELIGRLAASKGIVIVSGYATGIDTTGHLGAMDAEGKTIAVLGSEINVRHPEKPALERYILGNGIFISELDDPDAPREYKHLMARDRITAELSDAIFVIETDPDGGAVHTARIGKEQGRMVYTINWDESPKYKGKHQGGNTKMISDGIAKPIPILDADKEFETEIQKVFEGILKA